MTTRSGIGYDVHPLVEGRPLVLGGVTVPFDRGLLGHSDGDVLTHAIVDAVLGGAGLGDIGRHFPSDDERYRGAVSLTLLAEAVRLAAESGWRVAYVDATIVAESPRLSPILDAASRSLAESLGVTADSVNLKATTTDGLGFAGRGEGIAAMAVATLDRIR